MIETLRFIRHSFQILSFFFTPIHDFWPLENKPKRALTIKFSDMQIHDLPHIEMNIQHKKIWKTQVRRNNFSTFIVHFEHLPFLISFFFVFLITTSVFAQPRYGFPIFCFVSREFGLRRISYSFDRSSYQLSARTIWRSPYYEIRISVQTKLWRSCIFLFSLLFWVLSFFLSFFFWYNFSGELLNLLLLSFVEIRSD